MGLHMQEELVHSDLGSPLLLNSPPIFFTKKYQQEHSVQEQQTTHYTGEMMINAASSHPPVESPTFDLTADDTYMAGSSPGLAQQLSPYPPYIPGNESFYDIDTLSTPQIANTFLESTCEPVQESLVQDVVDEFLAENGCLNAQALTGTGLVDAPFSSAMQCTDPVDSFGSLPIERCMSPSHIEQYLSLHNSLTYLQESSDRKITPFAIVKQESCDQNVTLSCRYRPYDVNRVDSEARNPTSNRKRKTFLSDDVIQQEMERVQNREKLSTMTTDEREKYFKRKLQNREAAARCRDKKKKQSQQVHQQEQILIDRNEELVKENDALRSQLAELQAIFASHLGGCKHQTHRRL